MSGNAIPTPYPQIRGSTEGRLRRRRQLARARAQGSIALRLGQGGTGKSTVSAALALALAAGGRRVLLVEVEARQSIAQLFDLPPLPPTETKIATARIGNGEVWGLALDTEYVHSSNTLDMFYNLGIAGRAMKRMGAVEFVTTLAPGLRDVILTGKIKECVVRVDKEGKQV